MVPIRINSGMRLFCSLLSLWLVAQVASAQSPWETSYAREAAGDYGGALDALATVLDATPDHEFAILRSGWLRYLNGDYNASLRDYQRALALNENSIEAALGITLPLLAQQRWREAAAQAQSVLADAPGNYYGHIRLLAAQEGLQQWRALADHAAEVSARFPSDATILVYLARARAWQGNVAAARAAYERVLERVPGHEEAGAYLRDSD